MCVYSCTNARRIHITPGIWMFPRHSSCQYQKSLRWRLMRHTLLSSLAPQIIHRQQSEVEALRTHTDSHYVHILPPVLSCLQQRQIKGQQDGFSLCLVNCLQMMTSFMVHLIRFGRGLIFQWKDRIEAIRVLWMRKNGTFKWELNRDVKILSILRQQNCVDIIIVTWTI